MFDFPIQGPSVGTALFACFSYLFVLESGYIKYKKNKNIVETFRLNSATLYFWAILMVVHTTNGDFFHLMEIVHEYEFIPGAYHAQEPVYVYLAQFINKNYLLFRLIVFGGAFVLILKIYKNLGINKDFAIWVYLICYSILFAYARASVAMAVYYFGLMMLIKQKHGILHRLLGVALILLSYEFHHSMLILIVLTPLAFIRLSKKLLYVTICVLPIIIVIVRIVFLNILGGAFLDDEELQKKMERYSVRVADITWRSKMMDYIKYFSIYMPFVASFYYIVKFYGKKFYDKTFYRLFVYVFWLFMVTSAVSFLDMEVNTFFYRLLYMTVIPSVAIFVYMIQKEFLPVKIARRLVYLCVFSQMINYLYMLYNNILTY